MKKILAVIVTFFACQTGYADNWYVGAGIGLSYANDASQNVASGSSTLAQFGIGEITSYNNRSGTFSLLGGYRFNNYAAAEVDYTYLGTFDMHGYTGPGRTPPSGREKNQAEALALTGVLAAPVSDTFSLYGKFGPTLTVNDERTCVSNIRRCDSTSDIRNGLIFGIGGSITPPRLIGALRIELDRFSHVGDTNNEFTAGRFSLLQVQYVYTF
jgi:hypothetical protein